MKKLKLILLLIAGFLSANKLMAQDTTIYCSTNNGYYRIEFPNGFKPTNEGFHWEGIAKMIKLCSIDSAILMARVGFVPSTNCKELKKQAKESSKPAYVKCGACAKGAGEKPMHIAFVYCYGTSEGSGILKIREENKHWIWLVWVDMQRFTHLGNRNMVIVQTDCNQ